MKESTSAVIIIGEVCIAFVVVMFLMQQCALEDIRYSGSGKTLYGFSSIKR